MSPADVCLLLALLLVVSGTIAFPSEPRRPAEIARIVMDGVVIGGSLLFFASVTLFPQIVGPDGDIASRALPLLVPVIDIVIATTALLLFLRRTTADGAFLGLVSIGFALFSISDFSSAIVTVSGPFAFGTIVDIGWIAGYMMMALAVRSASSGSGIRVDHHREGSAVAGTTFMFTVFFVGAAASLRLDQTNALEHRVGGVVVPGAHRRGRPAGDPHHRQRTTPARARTTRDRAQSRPSGTHPAHRSPGELRRPTGSTASIGRAGSPS